jgi:uncharacterized membrane protein
MQQVAVPEPLFFARLIHILSAIGWLGEVLTVNFVLLPALRHVDLALRGRILLAVFPLIFRLATILGALAVLSGAVVFLIMSGGDFSRLFGTTWGQRILIGGVFGGLVFVFHLVQESRMEGSLATRLGTITHDTAQSDAILRHLQVIPRIGLLMLVLATFFMSSAARLP